MIRSSIIKWAEYKLSKPKNYTYSQKGEVEMSKPTYLNQLKETRDNYLTLRKGEPEGTHYYNDLTLCIERVENTIKNLEFAKTNPLVMVPSAFEQGGISDRLSNFDSYGDRIRERS